MGQCNVFHFAFSTSLFLNCQNNVVFLQTDVAGENMLVNGVLPFYSPESDSSAVSANCLAVAWQLCNFF